MYLFIMNDKTVKLCSDNFETNAPNTFRKLWNAQDFIDVTLATVDDQQIRAHKLILISCSEFFRNIFLKNQHQNPLLYLKGIRYKELMMVLKFIYLGQCEVGQNELQDFLATGHDLKVEGLMEVVNFKETEEPVVDNGTHNVQEHHESFCLLTNGKVEVLSVMSVILGLIQTVAFCITKCPNIMVLDSSVTSVSITLLIREI